MAKALIVAAVLALLAAGCSRPDSTRPSSGGTPPVQLSGTVNDKGSADASSEGASPSVEIELANFSFAPTFVKIALGAKVSVSLKNSGMAPHTFTITGLGVDTELASNKAGSVTFTAPSAGIANFVCRFHKDSGMQGAFYSTAGASASPNSGGGYGY